MIIAVITKKINAHNFIKFHAWANPYVNFPYPVTGPFQFKVFGSPPLYMQKAYSKLFLGITFLSANRISKYFAAHLKTFGVQRIGRVIVFCIGFRKALFCKRQFQNRKMM